MGKRKLCASIVVGAIVGGLVALTDRSVRNYAKNKVNTTTFHMKYCLKNPAESVHKLRTDVTDCHKVMTSGLESTINALEQIEQTLEKVVPQKNPPQQRLK